MCGKHSAHHHTQKGVQKREEKNPPMDIELRGIHKSFGSVHANNDISLKIPSGTIQGVLGENGAGKSTLMKILSGFIVADQGEILLDGKKVDIDSPEDAIDNGIGMLHQDPLDFSPMKVVNSFALGGKTRFLLQRKRIARKLSDLQEEFDFSVDLDGYIDTLTVGERQQLEILRLLWLGSNLLILDEPTTGISAIQKDKLFSTMKTLAKQGKTIIFVTHKLEDVVDLCDCVVVLRRGNLVGEMKPPYDLDGLVRMMFGKEIKVEGRTPVKPGEPVLLLENVSAEDFRLQIKGANLRACEHEVIGLAGMEGSGQPLFLRACCGLQRTTAGHVYIRGKDMTGKGYHAFMQEGVGFMPAARLEEGLFPGLTLTEHFALARDHASPFVLWNLVEKKAEQGISDFNIYGKPDSTIESLSGGNQQRALLSLLREPLSLLLLEQPTRGLDVESAVSIWNLLKQRAKEGTTIIFISSDLDEIMDYSNRILVFFSGKVSAPLDASTTSVDQLGQLIGGLGWEEREGEL
jgi:ABC-type uncharacterized transport system ATPase subunit